MRAVRLGRTNAIILYLAVELVDFKALCARLVGTGGCDVPALLRGYAELVASPVLVGLVLLLARFLYRRQIVLRV